MVDLFSAVEPWEAGDGDKLTPPADANAWVGKVSERSPRASSGAPPCGPAGRLWNAWLRAAEATLWLNAEWVISNPNLTHTGQQGVGQVHQEVEIWRLTLTLTQTLTLTLTLTLT